MKRPAIVTPWYGEGGGVAVAVENLVGSLCAYDCHPLVIIPLGNGWLPRFKKGKHGETIVLFPLRNWASQMFSAKAFVGYWARLVPGLLFFSMLILVFHCKVVHFHYFNLVYIELLRLCKYLKIPCIITFHGSDVMLGLKEPDLRHGLEIAIKESKKVVTVSAFLYDVLKTETYLLNNDKGKVIWNSVPTIFWDVCGNIGKHREDFDVLFVGSLQSVKGPDILVRAINLIQKKLPKIRCAVIGSGEMEASLKNYSKEHNIIINITFFGEKSRKTIPSYYKNAQIVAIPSRMEGMPLVAIEAAITGKPVIATSVGGLTEVVIHNKTGILIPPECPSKLAEAIIDLLKKPSYGILLGQAARQRAKELFSPKLMAQKYIKIYNSI